MADDANFEKANLTGEFHEDFLRAHDVDEVHLQRRRRRLTWATVALFWCLTTISTALLSANFMSASSSPLETSKHSQQTYSPADEAIRYQTQILDLHHTPSPFSGKPRPEFEQAWYNLLYYTNIRVTANELRASNQTSIKIRDEEHYIAYLEVYHQLHCIKRMVQTRYPEYYPELVARGKLSDAHFDHCIEVLRLGTMCRADTSLATLHWNASAPEKVVAASARRRQCVDWPRLTDWAADRFTGEDLEFEMAGDEAIVGPLN